MTVIHYECVKCWFYIDDTSKPNVAVGLCRRYPPQGANLPEVADDSWCGEWLDGERESTKAKE